MLLENGANASVRDSLGATPLHHATFVGKQLLNNQAKTTIIAHCLASIDTVETLMRHPDVNDEPDGKGRTALMWAASSEDGAEVIQMLCRHGANLAHK